MGKEGCLWGPGGKRPGETQLSREVTSPGKEGKQDGRTMVALVYTPCFWLLLQAVFSPEERHKLRLQHCLLQLGFGQGSGSVWMEGDLACKRAVQAQSNC